LEEINTSWEELSLLIDSMENSKEGDGCLDGPNLGQTPMLHHLMLTPDGVFTPSPRSPGPNRVSRKVKLENDF
jgi:hypothetical protein